MNKQSQEYFKLLTIFNQSMCINNPGVPVTKADNGTRIILCSIFITGVLGFGVKKRTGMKLIPPNTLL